MAKRRKKKSGSKKNGQSRKVIGASLFVLALILLISLITHSMLDDARITGDVDGHLNPFEIRYRNQAGMLGAFLSYVLVTLTGWLSYFAPAGLILLGLRLFSSELGRKLELNSFLLFLISLMGTACYNIHLVASPTIGYETGAIGGYLGEELTFLLIRVFGELGSYVVVIGLAVMMLMTYTSVTPLLSMRIKLPGAGWLKKAYGATFGVFKFVGGKFSEFLASDDPEEEDDAEIEDSDEEDEEFGRLMKEVTDDEDEPAPKPRKTKRERKAPAPKQESHKREEKPVTIQSVEYRLPTMDLLNPGPESTTSVPVEEQKMTGQMLRETLETFQIAVQGDIVSKPGPIITRYEFKPGAGVKINRIVGLADDLALALKARRIRIVAPIPGKAAVGVEIPNRDPQMVFLREILDTNEYNNPKLILPLTLGKTISGRPFVADLTKMPHLLIAGATGSGKSVCMNVLITSLLYRLHPLQLRLVFVDPKMLELSIYAGIPHLARPVVTSPKRAEKVLGDIVVEMEKRYRKLANASVRNIEDFNKRQKDEEDKLPYIVVFVDELADLMMAATSSKIEGLITRLAQMARAVGIHLILATQRPSVDVITGLIKANFPARIAFQVASKVDSRTIIDANGAEKLLGNGDMLFLDSGQPEPVRIHGAYMSSEETEKLVEQIKSYGLPMMALEGISQETGEVTEAEVDLGDPLFKEACEVVVRHKQGSVSLLQRRLGIGYQRAARLIDKLEQAGVVGTFDGSKARDVLVDENYIKTLFAAGQTESADKSD